MSNRLPVRPTNKKGKTRCLPRRDLLHFRIEGLPHLCAKGRDLSIALPHQTPRITLVHRSHPSAQYNIPVQKARPVAPTHRTNVWGLCTAFCIPWSIFCLQRRQRHDLKCNFGNHAVTASHPHSYRNIKLKFDFPRIVIPVGLHRLNRPSNEGLLGNI